MQRALFARLGLLGLLGSLFLASLASGCATIPLVPLPRSELIGSTWKLVVVSGRMDHRVVRFEKKDNRLVGTVIDKGRFLSQLVGIPDDLEAFAISPTDDPAGNVFEGLYRDYMGDGRLSEQQVVVIFYKDHFTWDLQAATWSRME